MSKITFYLIFFMLLSCQIKPHLSNKKVVLISIDGLRPEFYLTHNYDAPTLKMLAQKGVYAEKSQVMFPSVTYPNHTTMVTGKTPSEHGIYSNTRFSWFDGPTTEWHWYARHIRVKALWDYINEANGVSAGIHWPVTAGANITYNIPEIFETPPWFNKSSYEVVNDHDTGTLASDITKTYNLPIYENQEMADNWATVAFKHIYKTYSPHLTLLHLTNTDKQQHEYGRQSQALKAAVKGIDQHINTIVKTIDQNTCLILAGDHGFISYNKTIHINRLFMDRGWIRYDKKKNKVISFDVIAHKSGGQAAIYLKNLNIKDEVLKTLKEHEKLGYKILSKTDLNQYGSYPDALVAITALDGYSIGKSYTKNIIEKHSIMGTHGNDPAMNKMQTGFIAYNCGEKAGSVIREMNNLQITPSILKFLKLDYSNFKSQLLF